MAFIYPLKATIPNSCQLFILCATLVFQSHLFCSSAAASLASLTPCVRIQEDYPSKTKDDLSFRAIKAEHQQLFVDLFLDDPDAATMLFLPESYRRESLEIFLTDIFPSSCFNPKENNYAYFIYQQEQLIGYTETHAHPSLNTPNVSIFIIKPLRRQGLATKALLELKSHIEKSIRASIFPRIYCRKDNLSIRALIEKHDYIATEHFDTQMLKTTTTPLQVEKTTILSFMSGHVQRNYKAIRRAIEQDSSDSSDDEDRSYGSTRRRDKPASTSGCCALL